jgi:hypothetical protein
LAREKTGGKNLSSEKFSKIEAYMAETIFELKDQDLSTFFPMPKTLRDKLIRENKSSLIISFSETNDREKLRGLWKHMIDRCHNPKSEGYKTHGERGTTVCEEWRNSFDLFCDWSITNGYKFGLSLDRKENSKGYSPDNCWWTNHKTQARNRDNLKKYEAFGESKIVSDWADDVRCIVTYECLRGRIKKKWDFQKALTEPSKKR